MDLGFKLIFAAMMLVLIGTGVGSYAHCDIGFATIDWARGIETRCNFSWASRAERPN